MRISSRRLAGAAVAVALAVLGLAVGLALGTPASAQGADDIQISMGGGPYTSGPTAPLLNLADLAPGGSTSKSMWVKNNSTHSGDLSLTLTVTGTGKRCARASTGSCDSLAKELQLTLTPSGQDCPSAPVWTYTALTLRNAPLATGLRAGEACQVTLSAALADTVGNDVQRGGLAFDLQLALAPVNSGSRTDGTSGTGTGNGSSSGGGSSGNGGNGGTSGGSNGASTNGVAGVSTHRVGPGGHSGGHGILGVSTHRLASTGTPLRSLAALALALMIAGLILLAVSRRSCRAADHN